MTTITTMLEPRRLRMLALALLVSQSACAKPDQPSFAAAPFPAAHARYETRLFDLTEKGKPKYDADFANRFDALLAPQVRQDPKFRLRMTSGPTAGSEYYSAGNRGYVYFGICQAHWCDRSTMAILYEPASKKMVGKVLDRCKQQWLGEPDAAEQALLDARMKASYPAALEACAGKQ